MNGRRAQGVPGRRPHRQPQSRSASPLPSSLPPCHPGQPARSPPPHPHPSAPPATHHCASYCTAEMTRLLRFPAASSAFVAASLIPLLPMYSRCSPVLLGRTLVRAAAPAGGWSATREGGFVRGWLGAHLLRFVVGVRERGVHAVRVGLVRQKSCPANAHNYEPGSASPCPRSVSVRQCANAATAPTTHAQRVARQPQLLQHRVVPQRPHKRLHPLWP